ncbi:hypothetical protein D9C73_009018 [Collichthys lucidus]|uniref:Uncharacterized protein n=1 Tax=Collichthys lucidus TaxID=240159 RepID=A0A4U5UN36_COLLU|nr:hypothetical protein D9C73_009018 [Collichthys lucidus]
MTDQLFLHGFNWRSFIYVTLRLFSSGVRLQNRCHLPTPNIRITVVDGDKTAAQHQAASQGSLKVIASCVSMKRPSEASSSSRAVSSQPAGKTIHNVPPQHERRTTGTRGHMRTVTRSRREGVDAVTHLDEFCSINFRSGFRASQRLCEPSGDMQLQTACVQQ